MRALVLAVLISPISAFFLSPIFPFQHKSVKNPQRLSVVPSAPQLLTPTSLAAVPSGVTGSNKLYVTGNNIQVIGQMVVGLLTC